MEELENSGRRFKKYEPFPPITKNQRKLINRIATALSKNLDKTQSYYNEIVKMEEEVRDLQLSIRFRKEVFDKITEIKSNGE